ncbi:telomerase inhibitor [Ciborinia camelliae]|nr:telomerase inhibitor [Ciborinia camelliae]
MGLSAPKNKIKLSHDPNNTRWSGNTDSFGHRMMKSQGWTPGEYLGAKDAAHAEFHTAANASHIRVVIKDNNLGLGAKVGSGVGHGECTGLDVFQNLLGRLNGKEEAEIEKEQKGRDDLKRAIYAERKWGSIRFVKGGVLIGDKIQDLIDGEKERVKALELKGKRKASEQDTSSEESDSSSGEEEEEKTPEPVVEKKKSSLKRKRDEQEDEEKTSSKKNKKEKKNKKRKGEDEDVKDKAETKNSKKSNKDRKSKSKSTSESETESLDEAALNARKKEKKEKRRREKEAAAAAGADTEETTSTSKSSKKKSKKDKHKSSSNSESSTKESTPVVTGSSGRSTPMGIHSIRARNIAQKRMASMDVASLNQIFMIKSQI